MMTTMVPHATTRWWIALLLLHVSLVDAVIGNLGWMKFKPIPGGFNADIPEQQAPITTTSIVTTIPVAEPPLLQESKQQAKVAAKLAAKKLALEAKQQEKERALQEKERALQEKQQEKERALQEKQQQRRLQQKERQKRRALAEKVTFDTKPFVVFHKWLIATNAMGCAVSLALTQLNIPTHYHVDLIGTGALAVAARPFYIEGNSNKRIQLTSAAVMLWSTKLATYLCARVATEQGGIDRRLTPILQHPSYCAGFWAFSALFSSVCGLPYSVGLTSSQGEDTPFLNVGLALFGAGWLCETLADLQKWQFKQQQSSGQSYKTSAFCQSGLWKLSQHPNWFGNLLLWSGLWVANLPALYEPPQVAKTNRKTKKGELKGLSLWLARLWGCRRMVVAAVGPWFLWNMFHQQATGEMLAETFSSNRQKYGYGSNKDYTQYIDNTPLIVPKQLQIPKELQVRIQSFLPSNN